MAISIFELMAALGSGWDDFLMNTDGMLSKRNNLFVVNGGGDRSVDMDEDFFAVNLMDRAIPPMTPKLQAFVTAFKAKYGDDSILPRYGLVKYAS